MSHSSSYAGASLKSSTVQGVRPRAARRAQLVVRSDSALIVNTKGGGHAFLGLHLAKKLIADGHKVTILKDGDKVGAGRWRRLCWVHARPGGPHAGQPHLLGVLSIAR